jgi:hypothetical protein
MGAKCLAGVLILCLCFSVTAFAKTPREISGSYKSAIGTSGTFSRSVSRQPDQANKNVTWTNQNGGVGNHSVQRNLNSGALNTTGSTVLPNNMSVSTNRTITSNADGGYSVQSTYTTGRGKTISTGSTIQKTDAGLSATGSYALGNGKTGSYGATAGIADGQMVKTQSLVTDSGKSIQHSAQTGYEDGTFTRNDTLVLPNGNTKTLTVTATPTLSKDGLSVTGDYSTGGGRSGSYESLMTVEDGALITDQSVTNSNGISVGRHAEISVGTEGGSQDVTLIGPQGNEINYTRSIDLD